MTPPTAVEVTLNDMVQEAPAARLAMDSENALPPGTAVATPPGQVVAPAGLGATTMPLGGPPASPLVVKWSVSAMPETEVPPPVMVTVMRLTWPGKVSVPGLVVLLTDSGLGGANSSVPTTGVVLTTPAAALMPPAGMVLTQSAAPIATTSKTRSQLPPPARPAPDRPMLLAPAAPAMAIGPAQLL